MTINWMELWIEDKESMIATVARNMQSDIEAGYNPSGKTIIEYRQITARLENEYEDTLTMLLMKDDKTAQRWCYYDLKKRGVIE